MHCTKRTLKNRHRRQFAFGGEFEKTLLPYEKVAQPRIADVTLAVDLFPRAARAAHGPAEDFRIPQPPPAGNAAASALPERFRVLLVPASLARSLLAAHGVPTAG